MNTHHCLAYANSTLDQILTRYESRSAEATWHENLRNSYPDLFIRETRQRHFRTNLREVNSIEASAIENVVILLRMWEEYSAQKVERSERASEDLRVRETPPSHCVEGC